MKKNYTKLSWQITFIIGAIILIVAGTVAAYMQFRIVTEIRGRSELEFLYALNDAAVECGVTFTDAAYGTAGMRRFVETNFDLAGYQADAERYANTHLRPAMDGFIRSIIGESDFISAAYVSLHPDLAGYPYVCEIYWEETGSGFEPPEPQTYEEYMQTDSEDMMWFYGAYTSGAPYWSPIYEWDGVFMVSYAEPVRVGGRIIGIAGVDIEIGHIAELLEEIKIYDTGFALLKDSQGALFESNDIIQRLAPADRERLAETAGHNHGGMFAIHLGGVEYAAASSALFNGYELLILAPKGEYNAKVIASITRFIVIFIIAYGITLVIAHHIGKKTGKPIGALSAFMRRVGTTGDITYTAGEEEVLTGYARKGDEIGLLIADCGVFTNHIIAAARDLEELANGDLTIEAETLSDKDTMASSLNKMIGNLNTLFGDVHKSAMQVADGSKQIADGASSLANGASEQSGAIDELSAAIRMIHEQISQNATVARDAAELSDQIRIGAEKGSAQMDSMMQAVKDIDDASNQISKVIKIIDDIAFQTNILALNAAVEAARAGQHGKGFAVVAEEVRNLAAKSAEAAKDTGGLIESTVTKAHLGMDIAVQTAESLKEIVDGINRSAGIISKIADESDGQLAAIDQLNTGIGQVSQVIQQNSAAAEESAASAEEMNGQSAMLEELISQFKLKSIGNNPALKASENNGKY